MPPGAHRRGWRSDALINQLKAAGAKTVTHTALFFEPQAGRRHTDGRSDLYSLGVSLFQLLTGPCPRRPSTRDGERTQAFEKTLITPTLFRFKRKVP